MNADLTDEPVEILAKHSVNDSEKELASLKADAMRLLGEKVKAEKALARLKEEVIFSCNTLENDGDEHGISSLLRSVLAEIEGRG